MSTQKVHRISKDHLLRLLNKSQAKILETLNQPQFGLMLYLEMRKYTEEDEENQILEIILEILSRICSLRKNSDFSAGLDRILRMLKDCQQFLFDDIPRVLYSCISTKQQDINMAQFMCNYINVLRTLLSKDFFPRVKILNEIFPTLENYMNRLQETKVVNLDKAVDFFRSLRKDVERFEDPTDFDEDDCNVANFRSLSIVPKSSDIVNYEISNIPQNIIDAPYKSVDHFLSVHYRLTREDMLRSFRECVKMCFFPKDAYSRHRISESTKNNYFENVSVLYPPKYTTKGILYDIIVSTSEEIDWGKKELLTPGSLVFLSPDACNSVVFASIQNFAKADYSRSKTCRLKIKLEDDLFQDTLLKDTCYAMIQPSAYFECYKHVLSSIKDFSKSNFPLSDIIVDFNFTDPEPKYLLGKEYCLHEKCDKRVETEETCSCKRFSPLKEEDWPTSNDLELDDQQYNAFKVALTKKVAVIQGPPGTGKTYIGVKVVRALLENANHKPIVICCLTNHALDEFLERMLKFTKKIVRLGSQSKSKVLEPHKMENMVYAILLNQDNAYKSTSEVNNEVAKKSLKLLNIMAPVVFTMKKDREFDVEYFNIRELSDSITSGLNSYSLCQDKYLDDSALNEIIDSKYKDQLRHVSGTVRKSLSAGLLEWLVCSRSSDLYDKCTNKFYEIGKRKLNPRDVNDIWTLKEKDRFELFYYWRKICLDIKKKNLEADIEEYRTLMQKYKSKPCDPIKLEILKNADIIGVTTTGACKFKTLLQFTRPCIMLIEEAAQVLESHVIASLVPSIQHLILIGDHEQLRPLPADNELSEKYNLKVSMFERLFRNEAPSATLEMQHRMKPCIAELLVPRPYKDYKSFENVYKYEEIKGVESSVYFFDHCSFEDENSSGTSSSNDFEARMVVSLAKYLHFYYSQSQITILTTYALQVIRIHGYLMKENLNEIRLTTVDNFQGEENDIILLSFVRSNENAIGFLKESNRVCVALSRARMGMFCFGNFKLFSDKNDLWNEIVEKLRFKNMIGDTLSLKCPKHNTIYSTKSASDILGFIKKGCSEECNFKLPCKHICSRKCHFEDFDHSRYICKQPCEKMIDEKRVCPRLCYQKCKTLKKNLVELPCKHLSSKADSKCFEEVPRFLPCSHLVTVFCHVDIERYQCKALEIKNLDCGHKKQVECFQLQENVKVICTDQRQELGPCGHTIEVPCSMYFDDNDLSSFCNKSCGILLNCGHPCVQFCRFCFDTGIHGFCRENCELVLTCGHKCGGFCGSPCPPCSKKCFISCGHHTYCINDCLRPCLDCPEPCERKCRHNECLELCTKVCNVDPCNEQCFEKLPCGHQCIGLCGDICPSLCPVCDTDAADLISSDTGSCYVELECEHVIEVNNLDKHVSICLSSLEWPCCPKCSLPITKSIRYKKELKQAKQICIKMSDTSEENSIVLYLVECMFGKNCIVPAQFIPIYNEIRKILKRESPQSHTLMVLKNCVMLLKKLVNIVPEFKKYDCDDYVQKKFDTLILWLYNHLVERSSLQREINISFQQLGELEIAVKQLTDDVASMSNLGYKCDFFFEKLN